MKEIRVIVLVIATLIAVFCYYQIAIDRAQKEKSYYNNNSITEGNKLLLDSNTGEFNIKINPPSEYDFKTKEELFKLRKQYVAENKDLIDQNYTPNNKVYGQITSGKPWWGQIGINCKANKDHSIDGLSEESRFFNNPLLLVGIDTTALNQQNWDCTGFFPEPVSLTYYPETKTVKVIYSFSYYFRNIAGSSWEDLTNRFHLKAENARDFGYNYIYASDVKNIKFKKDDNVSSHDWLLLHYIHTGGSCMHSDGCNNGSPNQPHLDFDLIALPAEFKLKLWKQKPVNKDDEADLYYDLVIE